MDFLNTFSIQIFLFVNKEYLNILTNVVFHVVMNENPKFLKTVIL